MSSGSSHTDINERWPFEATGFSFTKMSVLRRKQAAFKEVKATLRKEGQVQDGVPGSPSSVVPQHGTVFTPGKAMNFYQEQWGSDTTVETVES